MKVDTSTEVKEKIITLVCKLFNEDNKIVKEAGNFFIENFSLVFDQTNKLHVTLYKDKQILSRRKDNEEIKELFDDLFFKQEQKHWELNNEVLFNEVLEL